MEIDEEHGSYKHEESERLKKGLEWEVTSKSDDIHVMSPYLYTSVHRRVWKYDVGIICPGVGL